jgi:hypothetical protein
MMAHCRIACARRDEDEVAEVDAEWPQNFLRMKFCVSLRLSAVVDPTLHLTWHRDRAGRSSGESLCQTRRKGLIRLLVDDSLNISACQATLCRIIFVNPPQEGVLTF